MPTLTRGDQLLHRTQQQVLRRFTRRWTHENAIQTYGGRCPACIQGTPPNMTAAAWHSFHVPLVSDAEWALGPFFLCQS
jgi:hypothetical protein